MEKRAAYWEAADGDRLRCLLCPHRCLIAPERTGLCRVRLNRDGTLVLPHWGRVSGLAMDPVEKKPLYHYHPGRQVLSVGFLGCSLRCPFCQNHRISQHTDAPARDLEPAELVELARREGSFGLAYTYSEPLVHAEYVLETARLARAAGLKNVLVTNGYLNEGPAAELLEVIDAANVDLKGFRPEFYRRELGGGLEEVKRFLRQAAGRRPAGGARPGAAPLHLEVTTLVIPGCNDGEEEIEELARFLAGLSPDLPYHLSGYFPSWRYDRPPTPAATLERLAAVARRHLRHVYLGNVRGEEPDTRCPSCGTPWIRRQGYRVRVEGIAGGRCRGCGAPVPIEGA